MPKSVLSFHGTNSRLNWSSHSQRDQSGCQFSGTIASTKSRASQNRPRRRGGSGSQPRPKAKPVKKMSCQPKGLKNQGRSDHHSAGRFQPKASWREVERDAAGQCRRRAQAGQRHDRGHHGEDDDVHRQDVEIVGHVGQRDQTGDALARLGEEVLQVERLAHSRRCPTTRCRAPRGRPRSGTGRDATSRPASSGARCAGCRSAKPWRRKLPPKASAEAKPEQKTNISVASLGPKRAGIQSFQGLSGRWAMKMMNIARPRKKSSLASRAAPGSDCLARQGSRSRAPRVLGRLGRRRPAAGIVASSINPSPTLTIARPVGASTGVRRRLLACVTRSSRRRGSSWRAKPNRGCGDGQAPAAHGSSSTRPGTRGTTCRHCRVDEAWQLLLALRRTSTMPVRQTGLTRPGASALSAAAWARGRWPCGRALASTRAPAHCSGASRRS